MISGMCKGCNENYTLTDYSNGRLCFYNPNCIKVDEYGQCEKCAGGYSRSINNECVYSPHCTSFYVDTQCSSCSSGYYLDRNDHLCYVNDGKYPHCMEICGDSQCSKCEEGYIP